MKPFKFSLQSVLDYRIEAERLAAIRYQKAQQEVYAFEQVLNELSEELNRLGDYLTQKDKLTAQEFQQSSQYRAHVGEQLLIQRQNLAYAKRKQDLLQQAWMTAYQEKEMMEKLKEKHWERYLEEMNRLEAKEMEEFAMMLRYRDQWEEGEVS